ncbi:thiol:disulfide interchange protein [Dysgonomonas sp. PH5-45]|uniref:protein-disulfide reductase DsbD family protein n=1 Tax=unclassified Dysgonomonas TaxID=2630389 RepID=UPI0024756E00|nr:MULTISPECIES: thioredoxin family protein [unclassified Dysgonomonas]MDH6355246.1 thiol:disulfide interchange protein [Dysgonomonas sp. PH5-45]MDH6388132.1 thiol:disulfide interchange protein [Dysgonomonas sp. PH5-37]
MAKKIFFLIFLVTAFASKIFAQDPVSWSFKLVDKGNSEVELTATATIQKNWHIYDIKVPQDGPNPTTLSIDAIQGATKVGSFRATRAAHKEFDPVFEMEIGFFANSATFVQRFKVTDKAKFKLEGDVRAQACDDQACMPPIPIDFKFSSKDLPATLVVADDKGDDTAAEGDGESDSIATTTDSVAAVAPAATTSTDGNTDLWTPVIEELREYGAAGSVENRSLLMIFVLGFGGGLVALLTPCVWPMIPMTVSFFLKRNKKSRAKAIKDALTYGFSIIVIYVLLGLVITGIFGASALNDLSTSALFNLIFFAILVLFAASFLGAFELVLPSSWTNKMDSKADSTTGILSIFFMAFTLVLVSFSCTGPIIGTLLVEAASTGAIIAPATGMFGFAIALSIPFSLFAIFPSWLESMPKSGGWLNSVKVVLGFLELALALKFLSVADMAYGWRILDREVFLVLWIIIFALLGLYLLGKLKFSHDSDLKSISVTRLFLAMISLSFALYMVPGLWGAPLKSISAFAPPSTTQDFNLYDGAVHAKFDNYEAGMEYARQNNKPVLVDFSGFGCVNCRKMEASVWIDPRVKTYLEQDYVLITLMVDDKTKLAEPIEVTENGKTSKLKTLGDKWSYLQRHKFGTNSQPYYVTLDHKGNPIGPSYAYDEDVDKYIKFLKTGLSNFGKEEAEATAE